MHIPWEIDNNTCSEKSQGKRNEFATSTYSTTFTSSLKHKPISNFQANDADSGRTNCMSKH